MESLGSCTSERTGRDCIMLELRLLTNCVVFCRWPYRCIDMVFRVCQVRVAVVLHERNYFCSASIYVAYVLCSLAGLPGLVLVIT